jgi:hypothetical protein
VDEALNGAALSPQQRQAFGEATKTVIGRMTAKGVERLHANATGFRYHKSHKDLTEAILAKYPHKRLGQGKILKGGLDRDGVLHLNGGGILFGRPATVEEFYGHELTHAIDGNGHEISASKEWQDAWEVEIRHSKLLSVDASRSCSEGFGEFGAMILGSGTPVKSVMELMPQCVKVWQHWGLG